MSDITFRSDMGVEYIDHMATDRRIAEAAWTSTRGDREGKAYDGLIRALARDGHTGTFEHNVLTVRVDVPLFVAREWHRHRTQSYNEVSGRYVEMEPVFYVPGHARPIVQSGKAMDYRREPGTETQEALSIDLHERVATGAWGNYQVMLDHGIAREVARNVLPLSTYTQFYATANLRNWLHFIGLRTEKTALLEIQEAASKVEAIVKDLWPTAHEAYSVQ